MPGCVNCKVHFAPAFRNSTECLGSPANTTPGSGFNHGFLGGANWILSIHGMGMSPQKKRLVLACVKVGDPQKIQNNNKKAGVPFSFPVNHPHKAEPHKSPHVWVVYVPQFSPLCTTLHTMRVVETAHRIPVHIVS